MESALFETDLLTALEPGIPGGETPPSTAGGTPAATEARFMGSSLFEIDLLTDRELGNPGGETPPSTAGETPAATEGRFIESRYAVMTMPQNWDENVRCRACTRSGVA
jgi:hypothetical protein